MPDLLLELFSEEIPARMQAKAADDLRRMVTDKLVAEGLVYEGAKAFATPRRLALTVHGIPARQSDLKEERRGPRVGGADAAIQGFLKATGLGPDRRRQDPDRSEEGRFLHRADRKAGTRHHRRARRDSAGHHQNLPVAEIDALGRALGQVGLAVLGAAAAFDHRDLRARDRRARRGEVLRRRHRGRPDHVRPPLHGAGCDLGAPLRGLRGEAAGCEGRARSAAPQGHHPHRRQATGVRARFRTGRGSGAAGRGRRPCRVAGRADGIVRRGIPVDPGRGDPRHHPQQPEMLCGQRSQDGQADQQVHPHRQHRGHRRRQDHHRRQRARDPRAVVATRNSSTRPT